MVELGAELARLWETHSATIAARLATIDAAVAMAADGTLAGPPRAAAVRAAHELAGTAGTFGFAAASAHAAALEERLADERTPVDPALLSERVAALRASLQGAEHDG